MVKIVHFLIHNNFTEIEGEETCIKTEVIEKQG